VNYHQTGVALQSESNAKGITNFARPEDGHWADAQTFYFVTTGSETGGSAKLYKLDFDNNMNGGSISMIKDSATLIGSDNESARNFDNMTVDSDGNILIQEDPGNSAYIAKTWKVDIKTNTWTQVFESDRSRFISGANHFLTQDEENSGIIDVTKVLGKNDGKKYYMGVTQAHYKITGELVEGGQLYIISAITPEN
jgi:secreted PhoX family phosphatase